MSATVNVLCNFVLCDKNKKNTSSHKFCVFKCTNICINLFVWKNIYTTEEKQNHNYDIKSQKYDILNKNDDIHVLIPNDDKKS